MILYNMSTRMRYVVCLGVVIVGIFFLRTYDSYGLLPNHAAVPNRFVTVTEADMWKDLYREEQPEGDKPLCPTMPHSMGGKSHTVEVSLDSTRWEQIEAKLANVQQGGRWKPEDCLSQHRVAIIIPYRDRDENLRVLLNHLHPFLQKQQLDYAIYVIEQTSGRPFNRAKLFNVGYSEVIRDASRSCLVFHDVDLLPLDGRNLYACSRQPRHMSSSLNSFRFNLPYIELFGGAIAISVEQFKTVNGFANRFFGWGGEDDDTYERLIAYNMSITRWPMHIARYKMLNHVRQTPSVKRNEVLAHTNPRDGLSTLEYKVQKTVMSKLYTHVIVDV
ncbi:PREDICTED: beta-1,4-N-acetylgalactosaminyltransferase bre-4-like [Priapulus caudatus]|uniref:Beta-1,4-N-acetylgalactosaminyltransferase n=1 Tax=Priapulus caudatus TaxID=37621 RepID=A0ABM1E699_PRICU|nr:PREDICTED: beta-1,4-N-acetylgalactosaminyltransferase bre-4-like [Priapulus caudatus]